MADEKSGKKSKVDKALKAGKFIAGIAKKAVNAYLDEGKALQSSERHKDMTLKELKQEKGEMARAERGQDKSRERRKLEENTKRRKDQHKQAKTWLVDNKKDTPEFLSRIIVEKPKNDPYAEVAREVLLGQHYKGSDEASEAVKSLRKKGYW